MSLSGECFYSPPPPFPGGLVGFGCLDCFFWHVVLVCLCDVCVRVLFVPALFMLCSPPTPTHPPHVPTHLLVAAGVELLALIGKHQDACRYLQSDGRWGEAAWLSKVSLSEEESLSTLRSVPAMA